MDYSATRCPNTLAGKLYESQRGSPGNVTLRFLGRHLLKKMHAKGSARPVLNGVDCRELALLSLYANDDSPRSLDASHEMRRDVYEQLVRALSVPACAWPHFKLVADRFRQVKDQPPVQWTMPVIDVTAIAYAGSQSTPSSASICKKPKRTSSEPITC